MSANQFMVEYILSQLGANRDNLILFLSPSWRIVLCHLLQCGAFTMQLDSLKNTDKRQFKCKKNNSQIFITMEF